MPTANSRSRALITSSLRFGIAHGMAQPCSLRGSQTAPSPHMAVWPSGGLPAAVCAIASQPACLTVLLTALPVPALLMFCPTPLTQAAPWAESEAQVLKSFKTDLSKGLTDAQVTKLRAEYGTNELDKEEGTPLWKLVLQQFDDLLVKILLGAATLSFVRPSARSAPVHARPMAVVQGRLLCFSRSPSAPDLPAGRCLPSSRARAMRACRPSSSLS